MAIPGLDLVSIRARPEGRAMRLAGADVFSQAMFQSAPAPKDGRCRESPRGGSRGTGFNPRPPRRTGDALSHITAYLMSLAFQSAPAPKDGRCTSGDDEEAGDDVSIRARPEGRAMRQKLWRSQRAAQVSIRARPEGRAMPGQRRTRLSVLLFQSAPAPKDGRCRCRQT